MDSESNIQVWPRQLILQANDNEILKIEAPEEGHIRRDVPKNISAGLKPGVNKLVVNVDDDNAVGFAFALTRCVTRTVHQICAEIPVSNEEVSRERVIALLHESLNIGEQEEDEEITCVISNKLKLRCPLSFERVKTPVRGDQCKHLQCFGLAAYLKSNSKMRAMNNRWTCPVCGNLLKPRELRVDAYVEKVLDETDPSIEEVLLMDDGSYKCVIVDGEQPQAQGSPDPDAGEGGVAVTSAQLQRPQGLGARKPYDDTEGVALVAESVSVAVDLSAQAPPAKKRKVRQEKLMSFEAD